MKKAVKTEINKDLKPLRGKNNKTKKQKRNIGMTNRTSVNWAKTPMTGD